MASLAYTVSQAIAALFAREERMRERRPAGEKERRENFEH
jgi:hypothetical protein